MKVGRVSGGLGGACPFRDVARISRSSRESSAGFEGEQGARALLCDARNDDHAILSQLCLLIHLLNNHLSEQAAACTIVATGNRQQRALRIYLAVRRSIAIVYRRIIRDDVMRKLVHPRVLSFYRRRQFSPLDPQLDVRTPVELSHGVLRMGHAMVRRSYVVNAMTNEPISILEGLGQSGSHPPFTAPITLDWVVSWGRFFDMGQRPLNLSRRLSPAYAPPFVDKRVFPPIDEDATGGLAFRDLTSAVHARLLSAPHLIKLAHKLGASDLLPDDYQSRMTTQLREWIQSRIHISSLATDDIEAIVADPPLLLLILVEADRDPRLRRPLTRLAWIAHTCGIISRPDARFTYRR